MHRSQMTQRFKHDIDLYKHKNAVTGTQLQERRLVGIKCNCKGN